MSTFNDFEVFNTAVYFTDAYIVDLKKPALNIQHVNLRLKPLAPFVSRLSRSGVVFGESGADGDGCERQCP